MNGKIYSLLTKPATATSKLFAYDPSVGAASFAQVSNTNPGWDDSVSLPLAYINSGKVLIAANDGAGFSLFTFDGTTWTDIANLTGAGAFPGTYMGWVTAVNANGKFFFTMNDATSRAKLFSYKDSPQTLAQVTNINAGAHDLDLTTPNAYLIAYNNKVFFTGLNGSGKLKLYSWDDANQVLKQITDITGAANNDFSTLGPQNSDPLFTIYNNKLFFRASINAANTIAKYFIYDDNAGTLTQVTNIGGAATDSRWTDNLPLRPIVYNNRLYFYAYDSAARDKLYSLCDPATGCTP